MLHRDCHGGVRLSGPPGGGCLLHVCGRARGGGGRRDPGTPCATVIPLAPVLDLDRRGATSCLESRLLSTGLCSMAHVEAIDLTLSDDEVVEAQDVGAAACPSLRRHSEEDVLIVGEREGDPQLVAARRVASAVVDLSRDESVAAGLLGGGADDAVSSLRLPNAAPRAARRPCERIRASRFEQLPPPPPPLPCAVYPFCTRDA